MPVTDPPQESVELSSWKEIAEYLKVSVRTAQRYETELGLPVRRLTGEKGRAVLTTVKALSEWKERTSPSTQFWNSPKFLRAYAAAATIALVALGSFNLYEVFQGSQRGHPFSAQWAGATLVVRDERGEELWRRGFFAPPDSPEFARTQHIDLNGDGKVETLLPLVTPLRETKGGFLGCYSETGQELWKLQPKRAVSTRSTSFTDLYILRHYAVFPSPKRDGKKWVVAAFVHQYDFPSVIVVLDADGKQRGEYWHSGHLRRVLAVDLNGDGIVELLAAGTSRATSSAVVKILDPRRIGGAEQLPEGHPDQLLGFSHPEEIATIRFPRSRLNRMIGTSNFATELDPVSGDDGQKFRVHVTEELDRRGGYLVYSIRSDLSLSALFASESLKETYRSRTLVDARFQAFGEADLAELRKAYTGRWVSAPLHTVERARN